MLTETHGTVEDDMAFVKWLTITVEFHTTFQQHAIVVIIVVYKLSYDLQRHTHFIYIATGQ